MSYVRSYLSLLTLLFVFSVDPGSASAQDANANWRVLLARPDQAVQTVARFEVLTGKKRHITRSVGDLTVEITTRPTDELTRFRAKVRSSGDDPVRCYVALERRNATERMYTFNEEVNHAQILRQSAHDTEKVVGAPRQPVPMFAVETDDGDFQIAISDAPPFYKDYTTQTVNPEESYARIASGDSGKTLGEDKENKEVESYYHPVQSGKPHVFKAIVAESSASSLQALRQDVFHAIANRWSQKERDAYGKAAFATNYMQYRYNETGRTKYWLVPNVNYSNKQYTRDAFWQSLSLPLDMAQQAYDNEAKARTGFAERPLITLIWTYQIRERGGEPDMEAARKLLDYVERHTKNGEYYAIVDTSGQPRKTFQSWYDLTAFTYDDVITYNQGLLPVALEAAQRLGLKTDITPERAAQKYRAFFKEGKGYYPLSKNKDALAVDPLVGDLLNQFLFEEPLLMSEHVREHFRQVKNHARTEYGYKVTSTPSGDYLPPTFYDVPGFKSNVRQTGPGGYQWGGSWYLYDMFFVIDSYLHGATGAAREIIWRATLDFERGGTYYEHINTRTGEVSKPNQGWDGAAFAFLRRFTNKGRIDSSILAAIDQSIEEIGVPSNE